MCDDVKVTMSGRAPGVLCAIGVWVLVLFLSTGCTRDVATPAADPSRLDTISPSLPDTPGPASRPASAAPAEAPATTTPDPGKPVTAQPNPAAAISGQGVVEPVVLMSQEHEASCLVKVGDTMPEITLAGLDGSQHPLQTRLGEKLTVVVFWNGRKVAAREQYLRLAREVAEPFSGSGVHVVAINNGDDADLVRELGRSSEGRIEDLLDSDGQAMTQIATGGVPRTYLLDAQGKVLWMDIEYSRSSQRELRGAIAFHLSQRG